MRTLENKLYIINESEIVMSVCLDVAVKVWKELKQKDTDPDSVRELKRFMNPPKTVVMGPQD